MAISHVPETVRQAWGAEVAHDFTIWLEGVMGESAISEPEWRQANHRLEHLEEGLDTVKGDISLLQADVTTLKADVATLKVDVGDLKAELRAFRRDIDERFDRMNAEMNARFDRMNERFDELYRQILVQTRWTVGTLALFGTIIAILVAIGQL
jgi:septal ring factor EnvC (AmiA/AmiB activator)